MLIAKQKKNENIAEYILYIWQIEDLIRAYKLDIEEINKNIVERFEQPDPVKKEISNWYAGLVDMMKEENKTETGHLQFIQNTVNDLNNLHLQLIKSPDHLDYIEENGSSFAFPLDGKHRYFLEIIPVEVGGERMSTVLRCVPGYDMGEEHRSIYSIQSRSVEDFPGKRISYTSPEFV